MEHNKLRFEINKRILLFDIAKILGKIGLWKALREDLLFIDLFKAYNKLLY